MHEYEDAFQKNLENFSLRNVPVTDDILVSCFVRTMYYKAADVLVLDPGWAPGNVPGKMKYFQ